MAKPKKKKRKTPRNFILAVISKEDPTRYRDRTVLPEKGYGKKSRPRSKKVETEEV